MRAKLDGHMLAPDSLAGWDYVYGSVPAIRTFEVEIGQAHAILEAATRHGSNLLLDASDEGLGSRTISALTVLGSSASLMPQTRLVIVADRRWVWRYHSWRRSYNIRRKSGELRLLGEGIPRVAQKEIDLDAYAAWSLFQQTSTWTGQQTLKDAMDATTQREGFTWRDETGLSGDLVDVEGLEIDDYSDVGLDMVLAYFGLAHGVYIDDDGTAVLVDRLDDSEFAAVGAPPPTGGTARTTTRDQLKGGGVGRPLFKHQLWDVQDRKLERPSECRIHYVRAIELRVGAEEADTAVTPTTAARGDAPPRSANVMPLPRDADLGKGKLVRGTYVELSEFVKFLATQPTLIEDIPKISIEIIRCHLLHHVGLMAYAWPKLDLGGLWQAYIGAILAHFLLTYQLRKSWRDRVRSIRAYRVAIEDISTGGLAPSPVYADHAVWLTGWPPANPNENDPPEAHQIVRNQLANEAKGPGNILNTPIAALTPANAVVTIEDEEQAIWRVNYLLDLEGSTMRVIRGALDPLTLPTDDVTKENLYIGDGKLRSGHEVSTILTVSQAAPNDLRQFHTEVVKPSDAVKKMPTARIGEALGPPMNIRVSPAVAMARFAWDDNKGTEIHRAFGEQASEIATAIGEPINKSELRDRAIAEAVRIYTSFVDHVEGQLTVAGIADVKPSGAIASVSINARGGSSGGMTTTLDLPPNPHRVNVDSFLPAGTRRVGRRMLEP